MPSIPEKEIGEGRGCTIETVDNKNVYAWTNKNGEIVCLLPDGTNKIIGKGNLPLLKSVSSNTVVCVWQNENEIKSVILLILASLSLRITKLTPSNGFFVSLSIALM